MEADFSDIDRLPEYEEDQCWEDHKNDPRVWVVEITHKYSSDIFGIYDKLSLAEAAFERRYDSDMGAILIEGVLNVEGVFRVHKRVE